jgi:hypothetical protein
MPNGELPTRAELEGLLADIDAIIGLGSSLPASRFNVTPSDIEANRYRELWQRVDYSLRSMRDHGFPFFHRNQHQTLAGFWAWCLSFGESIGRSRLRPPTLYSELRPELQALREILARGAGDTPHEAIRELRESLRRTNEVFVIMALRPEVEEFYASAIDPAARAVGLDPFLIDRRETEEAIGEALLSSIRRALLVVCDLTFARPNCYFEAGYAKGAFRRIIFTARADHNVRAHGAGGDFKVHFDLDQFRITWWDRSDFQSSRHELEERLGTIAAEVRE